MINALTQSSPLQTAVLFLVFNRPDTTQQVFEAIRMARPPRLYVAADGPRDDREEERDKVYNVRKIATAVDWPCEIKTLFRETNLGCKYAVSGGITWFFEHEDRGIILEDDCLPSQSFFWFCESLLNRYKDDLRIWHISGASTIKKQDLIGNESYYFSKYNHIWGWATWASRWKLYDLDLERLPSFMHGKYVKNMNLGLYLEKTWSNNFKMARDGRIDTWDYQWYFTVWINGGLSIIPTKNMISNIGFGADATHTFDASSSLANQVRLEADSILIHPKIIMPNLIYDRINTKNLFGFKLYSILSKKIRKLISCVGGSKK